MSVPILINSSDLDDRSRPLIATVMGNALTDECLNYRVIERIAIAVQPEIEERIEDFERENRILWNDLRLQLGRIQLLAGELDRMGCGGSEMFRDAIELNGAPATSGSSSVGASMMRASPKNWIDLCIARAVLNLASGLRTIEGFGSTYVPYAQYCHRVYRERLLAEWPTKRRRDDLERIARQWTMDPTEAQSCWDQWATYGRAYFGDDPDSTAPALAAGVLSAGRSDLLSIFEEELRNLIPGSLRPVASSKDEVEPT